jgi:hypothetical protein
MTFNRSPDDGEKYFARPTDDLDKQFQSTIQKYTFKSNLRTAASRFPGNTVRAAIDRSHFKQLSIFQASIAGIMTHVVSAKVST